jgi:hypothetical protein
MGLDREARPELATADFEPATAAGATTERPSRGGLQFSSQGAIPAVSTGGLGDPEPSASETGFANLPRPKLPPGERSLLVREADNNLNSAYVAYSNATHNVRAQLKEVADDSSEFVLALLEVALGLAVPGLGRLASYSIKALANAPKAAKLLSDVVSAPEFGGIVTGITKAASISAKPGLPSARQHSSDETFLQALQKSFGDAKADIQSQIPSMSDEAVAAICTRFDRSNANEEIYGTAVTKLVTTMRALRGTFQQRHERRGGGYRQENEKFEWDEIDLIVNVGDRDDYETNELVICEEVRNGDPRRADGYHFKRRIPPEMRAAAIEMSVKKAGHTPHFVHRNDLRVNNVPGGRY